MTYTAGRTDDTGHADLAWALFHALQNEPLEGQTGRNTGFMEFFNADRTIYRTSRRAAYARRGLQLRRAHAGAGFARAARVRRVLAERALV